MRRKLSDLPGALDLAVLLPTVAALIVFQGAFPLRGFSQVAGPGSDDLKNQPGHALNLSAPVLVPPPKEPTTPQVKNVLDQMAAAGVVHPATLEQARQAHLFYSTLGGPPETVFRVDDRSIPGPAGDLPLRVYVPRAGGGLPIWVFFHGGGFVAGSLETHDVALRAVANRCDCVVVSVAYRLAPQSHYPSATDDAYAATRWVAEHAAEIDGDPQRIAIGGDGVGGNLAAVVSLMARDRGGPRISYQLLIYPVLNASLATYSWIVSADPVFTRDAMITEWSVYVPANTSLQVPYISPVSASSLRDLPPTLILAGENDPVRDDVDRFATDLKAAGVPAQVVLYPNTIHGFFQMAGALDVGKQSIDQTGAALKQALHAPNGSR